MWRAVSERLDDDSAAVDDGDVAWTDAVDCVGQLTNDHWTWHVDILRQDHVTKVRLRCQYNVFYTAYRK